MNDAVEWERPTEETGTVALARTLSGGYGGVGADGADTDHKSAGVGGDGRAQREKKVLDAQTWGSTARRNEEGERAGG